jgi:elongation factor Ts
MANTDLIKAIRARTSLSFKDITKAIEALQTEDQDKIIAHLREQGTLKAQARADRQTSQGGIFSYVHDGKIAVLVEVKCETDFVARSNTFQTLGNDIALHIVANQPKFVSEDQVDTDFINKELEIAKEQLKNQGKSDEMIEKILAGKKNSIQKDFSLLSQPFLKDTSLTVSQLVIACSQETGEKIEVTRFVLYTLNS